MAVLLKMHPGLKHFAVEIYMDISGKWPFLKKNRDFFYIREQDTWSGILMKKTNKINKDKETKLCFNEWILTAYESE